MELFYQVTVYWVPDIKTHAELNSYTEIKIHSQSLRQSNLNVRKKAKRAKR